MLNRILHRRDRSARGQALVEFALIAPLFVSILLGVIVFGIIVFYNQQLTNAAREAARFAAIHSATAQCPVVGHLDPAGSGLTSTDPNTGHTAAWGAPPSYVRCDTPSSWPQMIAFARSKAFGLNRAGVQFAACWSGYRTLTQYDAPPPGTYLINNASTVINSSWTQCSIGGADPTTNVSAIPCAAGLGTVDTASDMSEGQGRIVANRVTVYACYEWSPPGAGFLLIPQTVTLRAVISEPIQRQQ
jgi:TadE-like protein